jgi:geranylgeranyl diphosphate synthase type II
MTKSIEGAIERIARETLKGCPDRLEESMLYSLLGPGKRIRPRLVVAVSEAIGLDSDVAYRLAAALEMTHAYTLVHDDLPAMDDDDFRRGRPTNHKVFGEGLAVLAGDSLALLAPDVVLRLADRVPADRAVALASALLEAAGARGVVAGQAAEMELETGKPGALDALLEVFRKKTGALFRASLALPAIAAGSDPATIDALGKLGDDIGIAFQIADDLEDDFEEKRADPAHVAAYLDLAAARAEAERRLAIPAALAPELRAKLNPFLDEMRKKLAAGVAR